jgi:X-Pro dipeptidyl-peptidase
MRTIHACSSVAPGSRRLVRAAGAVLLVLGGACSAPGGPDLEEGVSRVTAEDTAIVVENKETQPVYPYAEAIRESVFVEAPIDSDGDGALDRIAIEIVRPKTDAGRKVASIMEASPYYRMSATAGTNITLPNTPLGHRAWYDQFFVPRGYAVVEVEMQGTARSAGCPTTGGKADTASIVAAIDWLNGRARAFHQDGTEAVATWSTGSVGMLGVSYNGTLPIAVAAQGTPGLKTIVPIAAISSWYDYARDFGIGYAGWDKRYPEYLAKAVANRPALNACAASIAKLGDDAGDDTYDYTPFWEERDYRKTLGNIQASVLLVHGLRDWNVKPHQFSRLWYGLAKRDVPRKIWLHREAHTDPVRLRPAEWKATMHHWMDHWLYGIDNQIMSEPMTTIQRPNGSWETHDSWPETGTVEQSFHPAPSGLLQHARLEPPTEALIIDDPQQAETALASSPDTQKPFRLAYLGEPLAEAVRISGTPHMHVAARVDMPSTPLSALLVDYGAASIAKPQDLTIRELMSTSCSLLDLENRTGCAAPPVAEIESVVQQIVSRGSIDVKNRVSIGQSAPLKPGQVYEVDWDLHPVEYVFAKGHRIGIVLSANNKSYVAVDPLAGGVGVRLDRTRFVLPVAPATTPTTAAKQR